MKDFKKIIIVLVLTGCFKKNDPRVDTLLTPSESLQTVNIPSAMTIKPASALNKKQREAIYFAASLEKEAIKVLTKNPSFDGPTLFSVLNFSFEANSGVKNKAPSPLDCSRFRIDTQPKNNKTLQIFKICQNPESRVAEIQLGSNFSPESDQMTVRFFVKEWISVLGYSAALGGNEIKCDLKIENKKLEYLSCEGWNRMLNLTASSAEELRLKTFLFERKGSHQFVLIGGIYKDLVEHKKIEVYVPLEGKIRRIENEIEVIDQYLEPAITLDTRPVRVQINPNSQGKRPEPEGDPYEKESQQKSKSDSQNESKSASESFSEKNKEARRKETTKENSIEGGESSAESKSESSSESSPESNTPKNDQNFDSNNGGIPPSPGR